MKLTQLISELQSIQKEHGDIEAQLQSNPAHDGRGIVNDSTIYVVPEPYRENEGGMTCNLRTWPY